MVEVNKTISCKYPKHGNRNILCNRIGVVEKTGVTKNGEWVKIKCPDGTWRNLSRNRMVDLKVVD